MRNDSGDRSRPADPAVAEALLRHLPVLRRFVARFFSQHQDIEDIAQEAYLRAFQSGRDNPPRSPRAFLLRVARNLALNELARKSRWMSETIESAGLEQQASHKLEDDLLSQQRLSLFCEAASQLPTQCRKVFLMRKVYGYTHREIASELGISEKTVEKHVATGLLRCSRFLEAREMGAMPPPRKARTASHD